MILIRLSYLTVKISTTSKAKLSKYSKKSVMTSPAAPAADRDALPSNTHRHRSPTLADSDIRSQQQLPSATLPWQQPYYYQDLLGSSYDPHSVLDLSVDPAAYLAYSDTRARSTIGAGAPAESYYSHDPTTPSSSGSDSITTSSSSKPSSIVQLQRRSYQQQQQQLQNANSPPTPGMTTSSASSPSSSSLLGNSVNVAPSSFEGNILYWTCTSSL